MTVLRRIPPVLLLLAGCVATAPAPLGSQEVPVPGLRIEHEPRDSVLAGRVRAALTEMPPLPGLPGIRPDSLTVILAPDEDRFREATGGQAPEWSAGVAVPSLGRIVLPTWPGARISRPGAGSLLRHEWAHVAVYRGSGGRRAPRWFTEGYAEWSGGWDRSRAWRLRILLAVGDAPPLDSLSLRWPADRAPAEGAYLLSASVVEYLVEASGVRGLEALFDRWRTVGDFDTALREVYGLSPGQLEDDWQDWARDRYGWVYVLTHSGLAWGFLALLLVATAFLRRRYNQDRLARLRARELPENPAWWTSPVPGDSGAGGVPGGPRSPGAEGHPSRPGDPGPPADGTSTHDERGDGRDPGTGDG